MFLAWLCHPCLRDVSVASVPVPPLSESLSRREGQRDRLPSWIFTPPIGSPGGPFFDHRHLESSIGNHEVATKIGTLKDEKSVFGGNEWVPMLGSPPWLFPTPVSLIPPGYLWFNCLALLPAATWSTPPIGGYRFSCQLGIYWTVGSGDSRVLVLLLFLLLSFFSLTRIYFWWVFAV